FSPFTQRALHPVESAVVYPAAERRPDLSEPTLPDDDESPPGVPTDLVPPFAGAPDLVWEPDEVRAVALEELSVELDLDGSTRLGEDSSGASSDSCSWPTRRSSASVLPGRMPGLGALSRASPTFAPATTSSTRTTASAACRPSRRRRSRASPATTCCSPSAGKTACTSHTSRSARSRATSARIPGRQRSPSSGG